MNRQSNTAQNAGTVPPAVILPCHGGDGAHMEVILTPSMNIRVLSSQSHVPEHPIQIQIQALPLWNRVIGRQQTLLVL